MLLYDLWQVFWTRERRRKQKYGIQEVRVTIARIREEKINRVMIGETSIREENVNRVMRVGLHWIRVTKGVGLHCMCA